MQSRLLEENTDPTWFVSLSLQALCAFWGSPGGAGTGYQGRVLATVAWVRIQDDLSSHLSQLPFLSLLTITTEYSLKSKNEIKVNRSLSLSLFLHTHKYV